MTGRWLWLLLWETRCNVIGVIDFQDEVEAKSYGQAYHHKTLFDSSLQHDVESRSVKMPLGSSKQGMG